MVTALPYASPAPCCQPDSLAAVRQLSQLSCKLLARLQSVRYGCKRSGPLQSARLAEQCQPSFDLSAQLRSDRCTSNGNRSALAAAGQLSCSLSAWLPHSQSTSHCQVRCTPFSPTAVFQPVCNQLARLQSVSTAAQCQLLCSSACIMSV